MVHFIRLSLNEKGRFLWSVYRITEKQKAEKARNIKEKQLKNSRNTVSKQLVALRSSASDNRLLRLYQNGSKSPENQLFRPIGTQCVMGGTVGTGKSKTQTQMHEFASCFFT